MSPVVELDRLDELWFQVAGTLCNLTCEHCFISCSPKNDKLGFLTREQVRATLQESVAWGVKEFYFTGGEPFLNRDLVPILVETLRYGPATVLTNGTVFKDAWLQELAAAEAASLYSLEIRISLDGFTPEMNDPVRGEGTFARTLRGVRQLVRHGFLPILTAVRTWSEADESRVVGEFVRLLREQGYDRPRLKILPRLQLGAEERRTGEYAPEERVTAEMLADYDLSQLLCRHSRIVTDQGLYVCPLLIDLPAARLGEGLADAARPFAIDQGACYTCYVHGAICTNAGTAARSSIDAAASIDSAANIDPTGRDSPS